MLASGRASRPFLLRFRNLLILWYLLFEFFFFFRNARLFINLSVRNFWRVCSQFWLLFEALLVEIQEEIHHFLGWEGGGLRGTKIANKNFVNKLAFAIFGCVQVWDSLLSLLRLFSHFLVVCICWFR